MELKKRKVEAGKRKARWARRYRKLRPKERHAAIEAEEARYEKWRLHEMRRDRLGAFRWECWNSVVRDIDRDAMHEVGSSDL